MENALVPSYDRGVVVDGGIADKFFPSSFIRFAAGLHRLLPVAIDRRRSRGGALFQYGREFMAAYQRVGEHRTAGLVSDNTEPSSVAPWGEGAHAQ